MGIKAVSLRTGASSKAPRRLWAAKGYTMIDKCKKLIGFFILMAAAVISLYLIRMYDPEFYNQTIHLTMAGDVDGLADYIASFGYGAFLVSIGLLIFCNVFGIPTIPFLTVNGCPLWSAAGNSDFLGRRSHRHRNQLPHRPYFLPQGSPPHY